MHQPWKVKPQFKLRDILVIFLGIAIGYSLNLTARRITSGSSQPAVAVLPSYVIEPPDILAIESTGSFTNKLPPISGKYPVGLDGRINLGAFGSVYVAGLSIAEAQQAIQNFVGRQVALRSLAVDVYAYNSKLYYVITRGKGVQNVVQVPIGGNETVLDAVARIGGVPKNGRLWISRPNGGKEMILPVAWTEISTGVSTSTNYRLWPRDRLYVFSRPTKSRAK